MPNTVWPFSRVPCARQKPILTHFSIVYMPNTAWPFRNFYCTSQRSIFYVVFVVCMPNTAWPFSRVHCATPHHFNPPTTYLLSSSWSNEVWSMLQYFGGWGMCTVWGCRWWVDHDIYQKYNSSSIYMLVTNMDHHKYLVASFCAGVLAQTPTLGLFWF